MKSALRGTQKSRRYFSQPPGIGLPVERRPPPNAVMTHWTIYRKPKDFPQGYVLRAHYIVNWRQIQPDPAAWYSDHVVELRAIVPPGLYRIMPGPLDDATILETWI